LTRGQAPFLDPEKLFIDARFEVSFSAFAEGYGGSSEALREGGEIYHDFDRI